MALKIKVSPEEYEKLAALPNTVESLTSHVGLKEEVAIAIFEAVGIEGGDDVSSIAFILDEEWEALIKELRVGGDPIPLGAKSRVRKLLLIARVLMDPADGTSADAGEGESNPPAAAPSQVTAPPLPTTITTIEETAEDQPMQSQTQVIVDTGAATPGAEAAAPPTPTISTSTNKGTLCTPSWTHPSR